MIDNNFCINIPVITSQDILRKSEDFLNEINDNLCQNSISTSLCKFRINKQQFIINKYGYCIQKENINQIIKGNIYSDLTIFPFNKYLNITDIKATLPYYLYYQNKNYFIVPLYYGIQKFGIQTIKHISRKKINIKFNNQLRDYQIQIINKISTYYINNNNLKMFGGGILSIPPGKGKTIIALYLACLLKVKTLVIVHKSFLVKQWIEKIQQFTDANIGIIRQKKIDIYNKDIVIGMLHSIAMKDYDLSIFKDFGLVIFDECHHLSAKTFSKAMMKLRIPYTLGLSATPQRKDGLEKIIYYFLGDIMYKDEIQNENVDIHLYNYELDDYEKKKFIYLNEKDIKYKYDIKITNLTTFQKRNDLITNIIEDLLNKYDDRKILILSSRCNKNNQLQNIKDELIKKNQKYENLFGFYTGKTSDLERKQSENKQIILATYELANEGLDIPDLNTLIFASPPKGNLDQCIGRILRKETIGQAPIVVDIIDKYDIFSFLGINRVKLYKKKNYNIISF